jgi:hypothetical protein
MFRARTINVLVGWAVGLLVLVFGGTGQWKLPFALGLAVLVSSYFVRIQTMWRQAPISAAILIAAGPASHSKVSGMEHGLHKVAEVLFECATGFVVSYLMSKVRPVGVPAGSSGG